MVRRRAAARENEPESRERHEARDSFHLDLLYAAIAPDVTKLDGICGASDNGAMTQHAPRLPFSLDPLIAEAKQRMRRRRLLVLALTLALAGAVAGAVLAVQAPSASASPRLTAFFSVEGQAPRGVLVSYADSRSPKTRVIEDGSVPLHANVSRHGVSFYEFRARIFTPGGNITCKLRLGSKVVVGHASGTNSLCVVKARTPRGAGTGGGRDRASFDLEPAPKPAVTATMVAAAHRDEAGLLRSFVAPPGAQRLAGEPALLKRLQTKIFGIGPTAADKFARFANWRVRSSVADVARFELAHQPRGANHEGCPFTKSTPLDKLCGVGFSSGPGDPANASMQFLYPRIHGLVGERELRLSILRLPGGWTALRVAATNHTWIPPKFRHRAPVPITFFVNFARVSGHPVAGQMFTGVKLVVAKPKVRQVEWFRCGATVGKGQLQARKQVSFAASPPRGVRLPSHGPVEVIACSWRIPADAAGKTLRLLNYSANMIQRHSHLDSRAVVAIAGTKRQPGAEIGSPEYSWVVRASDG